MRNMLAKLGVLDVRVSCAITDVSAAEDVYIAAPVTGVLKEAYCTVNGAVTVADTTLTFTTVAGAITETLKVAYANSAAGKVYSQTFKNQANRKVVKGQKIKIACDGGSTDTAKGQVLLIFERTRV